jgi:galactoside O-acetyltransferase
VIVVPGVTIGENTVIGAGSVVTKDIPANVVAVGNPCRVLRPISEHDKEYFTVIEKSIGMRYNQKILWEVGL